MKVAPCLYCPTRRLKIILNILNIPCKLWICSWEGQLEKTRSWKDRIEIGKNEVGKLKLHWKFSNLRVDPSHFIFEINVGKSRIRHTTTLKLNDEFLDRLNIDWRFKFRVVICRIRLFPTLISKIKWLLSELPLRIILSNFSSFPTALSNYLYLVLTNSIHGICIFKTF